MVSAGTLELLTFEAATLTLISTNAIPGTVGANTFTRPQPNRAQNRLQNRSRGACLPSATVPLRLFGGSAFFLYIVTPCFINRFANLLIQLEETQMEAIVSRFGRDVQFEASQFCTVSVRQQFFSGQFSCHFVPCAIMTFISYWCPISAPRNDDHVGVRGRPFPSGVKCHREKSNQFFSWNAEEGKTQP